VAQLRPELTLDQVRAFLRGHLGREPDELRALRPGELSRVYAYDLAGEPFVVRFNAQPEAFRTTTGSAPAARSIQSRRGSRRDFEVRRQACRFRRGSFDV
jgi:hypothetical protein